MRKRILGLGIIAAAVMLLSIAGTASAWFEVKEIATLRGWTGDIAITTYNTRVTNTLQPGDTQCIRLKVKNSSTRCPIKITSVVVHSKPTWLRVQVTSGNFNKRLLPTQFAYFWIWLKMKEHVTGHKGEYFVFKIQFTARNCPTQLSPLYQ